jgi:hypothetical protein
VRIIVIFKVLIIENDEDLYVIAYENKMLK